MPSISTISIVMELLILTMYVAANPNQQGFAQCETKVRWMQTSRNTQWGNEAYYRANGVDGSETSIRAYLGNVEHFCPAVPFAECETKVRWMQASWNTRWGNEAAYRAKGVDGSEASIRAYLGNVENFCPAITTTTTTVTTTDATATTTSTFEYTTTTTEAPTTAERTVIAATTHVPPIVTTTAASSNSSINHITKLKVLINTKVDDLSSAARNYAYNNDNTAAADVDNTMADPIVIVLGALFVLGCLVVGAVVVKRQRKLSHRTIATDVEAAIPDQSQDEATTV
jgi:hypothetical protein